eukprot:jgi/Botrbrau1/9295/Bobra.0111s0020.1
MAFPEGSEENNPTDKVKARSDGRVDKHQVSFKNKMLIQITLLVTAVLFIITQFNTWYILKPRKTRQIIVLSINSHNMAPGLSASGQRHAGEFMASASVFHLRAQLPAVS